VEESLNIKILASLHPPFNGPYSPSHESFLKVNHLKKLTA